MTKIQQSIVNLVNLLGLDAMGKLNMPKGLETYYNVRIAEWCKPMVSAEIKLQWAQMYRARRWDTLGAALQAQAAMYVKAANEGW